eukprot:CAMPEP_0115068608 /NCGR_PEP_ID=MMETSP0227-20121206/12072_1 /TAXON_ID=89957 /ORGANISM="Polarella glacialis, Strain CCMP 1383" /LENGTH=676 /DNA_ID=CAMNT_0002454869 /DNA_START=99 /DNA_END=2129 /DNA_ORIENTATION=-
MFSRHSADRSSKIAAAAAAAVLVAGCCAKTQAFLVASTPIAEHGVPISPTQRLRSQRSDIGASASSISVASVGAAAAVIVTAIAGRTARCHRATHVRRQAAASPKPTEQAMSRALPWMPVPKHLKNNPTEVGFSGDLGFDPLGFAADGYVNEVLQNFGISFDGLRWYRESELMHGRVAMLATFNVILRSSVPGVFNEVVSQASLWEFVQVMAMLEAYRGYRLLFNQDQIAGDLGMGAGPVVGGWKVRWDMTLQELAEKQYKELQNGRLAMLAFAGIGAQYLVTGQPIGFDVAELLRLQTTAVADVAGSGMQGYALTGLGAIIAADGIRRLSGQAEDTSKSNRIAEKALNLTKLSFGVQEPSVCLPAGVVAGQAPQQLEITEDQVRQFEEDGVIMIKGGMKAWVEFLQGATEYQIERPHIWSLVGRMSGMYDYIQRNMWMTNNGFRDFLYYSPLGHIVSQLGRTPEVRCSTDMLLVNPNRGFGWHQDNQNGPIDHPDAIRWWCAMDRCGQDDFGAPEYLLGSHNNKSVSGDAVFVDLEDGDLSNFAKKTKFIPEPGDLIIWNSRTIHRIVAPPGQKWTEGTQRRAIGGTMAKAGTIYLNKGGASSISDLAGHEQVNGELLGGPYFPRIFPNRIPEEEAARTANQIIGRSPKKIANLGVTLASNAGKYVSFTKVLTKR